MRRREPSGKRRIRKERTAIHYARDAEKTQGDKAVECKNEMRCTIYAEKDLTNVNHVMSSAAGNNILQDETTQIDSS